MTKDEKRLHRCCFIGQRPEKIQASEVQVKQWLEHQICDAILYKGITTFLTGMNMGVDLWAAQIVLKKRFESNIHLVAAVPWSGFIRNWDQEWKETYAKVYNSADAVQFISDHFHPNVFEDRNKWMIDHSGLLIGYCNGLSDATSNMIKYAHTSNIPVILYDEISNKMSSSD